MVGRPTPRLRHLLLAALGCFLASAATAAPRPQLFALMDPGDGPATFTRYLALREVDGIAVRFGWYRLEPADNKYDWQALDAAFLAARAAKKKVTLHIAATAFGSTPDWVPTSGAASYEFRSPIPLQTHTAIREIVPWDPTFQKEWAAFLKALAAHLAEKKFTNDLAYISAGAPVPEMSLISCREGKLGEVSYQRTAYLDAWKQSIGALHAAFPDTAKLVSAPVAHICFPDRDGGNFYREIIPTIREADGLTFATDLNAKGSARLDNLGSAAAILPTGLQFIGAYTDDPNSRFAGSLESAVCRGMNDYQARYMEFYKPDLTSPDASVKAAIALFRTPEKCAP